MNVIALRRLIADATIDEIFDFRYSLTYHPRWKDAYDHAVFSTRALRAPDAPPCCATAMEISPLNPIYGCNADPFSNSAFAAQVVEHEVRPASDGRVVVVSTARSSRDADTGLEQVSEVVWWMKPTPPVIESVQRRIVDCKTKANVYEWCTRLSQFVKCTGGMVAQRVVAARAAAGQGSVLCELWESVDLGSREPTEDDFVVNVAPTTMVRGLKAAPPRGKERALSLDMAGEDTVKIPEERPLPTADIEIKGADEETSRFRHWLWLINGLVLAALVSFVAFRIRRRRRVI